MITNNKLSLNLLAISISEAIYVVYIMNFFKTKYSLAHPFTYFENKYLYHPIGVANKPNFNICKIGRQGAYLIALYVLIRWAIVVSINQSNKNKSNNKNKSKSKLNSNTSTDIQIHQLMTRKYIKMFSIFVLILVFLMSLLNFNAVVYLFPFFITEIYVIRNIL